LYRKSSTVDIFIGLDNEHVMPERTVVKTEQGLRIMENTFGIMLQGPMTDSVPSPLRCNVAQIGRLVENFIQGEELGVAISPKCGSCKCFVNLVN